MDFARKIGKLDEPPTWKRNRPSFITIRDKLLSMDINSISEDHRLLNWKRWLTERKRLSHYIKSITGRSQIDQLQNVTYRFRSLVELKNLMEHTAIRISVIPDKYRGSPEFWRTPEYLPVRGDICLPHISLAYTRMYLNPTDLMRVGLSDLLAKEQSLIALKLKEDSWKRSEYLKKRNLELEEKIALLLPKEPEMKTLAIQGYTFRKKRRCRIPPIIITEFNDKEETRSGNSDKAIIFQIQDEEFIRRICLFQTQPGNAEPITWSLIFESEIDERIEKEIVLENKGIRVIIYHWQDLSFQLNNMNSKRGYSSFFFNKSKELAFLGQTIRVKMWYLSSNRGVFSESWQLVTKPMFNSSTFILRVWGCTIDTKYSELADHRVINEYLDRCIRDSVIYEIIEIIMNSVKYSTLSQSTYETLLSRDNFFNSQNSCHYYYLTIVMQLKKIYCNVVNENVQLWNLSLDMLRDIFLQTKNTNYRQEIFSQFNNFCKQSLRSDLIWIDIAYSNKHNAVYGILCNFVNLFDDKREFAKETYVIQKNPTLLATNQQKSIFSSQESEIHSLKMHSSKLINRSQEMLKIKKNCDFNLQSYKEIFFICIHKTLEETIEAICITIDFYIKLNELDKHKV